MSGWWRAPYLPTAHYFRSPTGWAVCRLANLYRRRTTAEREPLTPSPGVRACADCLLVVGELAAKRKAAKQARDAQRYREGRKRASKAAPPLATVLRMPPPQRVGTCARCNTTTTRRVSGQWICWKPACQEMEVSA